MALISLATSCVIEDGYEREPIAIGEAIASSGIYDIANYTRTFISIAAIDEYLATEDEELREQLRTNYIGNDCIIEQEGNNIIVYTYNYYGNRYTLHNITTDGKALRDGGVWQSENLRLFTTDNAITMEVTETNKGGIGDSASLNFEDIEFNIEQGYTFKVGGSFASNYDKGNTLNGEICNKLSFIDRAFVSGIIELRYTDEGSGYDDLVTVEYLDNTKIGISYLQYYKSVTNHNIR